MKLNFIDSKIWTDVRVTILITDHTTLWVFYGCSYAFSPTFFDPFIIIAYFNILIYTVTLYYWTLVYIGLLKSLRKNLEEPLQIKSGLQFFPSIFEIIQWNMSGISNLTHDECVSVFYVLILSTMLILVLFGGHMGPNRFYASLTYAECAYIVLLTLYPGRIARQKAENSDVSNY